MGGVVVTGAKARRVRRIIHWVVVVILIAVAIPYFVSWQSARSEQSYIDAHGITVPAVETRYIHSVTSGIGGRSGSPPYVFLKYTAQSGQTFTAKIEMTSDVLSGSSDALLRVRYDPRQPSQVRLVSQPGISEKSNGSWDAYLSLYLFIAAGVVIVFDLVWAGLSKRRSQPS